ncbi:protein FAR1-RELATED SEQUENCE 5, partial [Trifolium medium]|nr:protein FAR1-RELATED SEQUENCE 5 [Trifolium medium]
MDQPNTSLVNVKPSKVEDKGDRQSTNKPMVVEPAIDFRLQFTTYRKFTTWHEMQKWVCGEATKLRFVVAVAKSDNGGNNRKAYVVMGCQSGGSHRAYVNKKREATTTLK